MVDLDVWTLHACGLPCEQVLRIFRVEPVPMLNIQSYPLDVGMKDIDLRWLIQIQDGISYCLYPSTIFEAISSNKLRNSRRPRQRLDDLMRIDPNTRRHHFRFTLALAARVINLLAVWVRVIHAVPERQLYT
jgi:hypothetical protein